MPKVHRCAISPVAMLHPIIKPWLFHGWALDFVGKIHPASSKGHRFMLLTTDYLFTSQSGRKLSY
jgi:hypothetical protein